MQTRSAMALGLLLSSAALICRAQDEPVSTIPVQTLPEDQPAATPEKDATPVQLEAVVVKGEKLGRTLANTASSVNITTGKQIENYGDQSLYDLTRRVGNALADDDGNLSLRGVSGGGAEGYSTGSPVISIYVDGVALDQTATGGNAVDAFDLEQVEILRGPQSTSQGRNALAGAVVSTTRDPSDDWQGLGRVRLSDAGGRQYALAGGGPLGAGFAFRLTGNQVMTNGDLDNITRHDPKWARKKDQLYRGKLGFKPAAIPGLKAVLSFTDTDTDRAPDFVFIADTDDEKTFRRKATDNVDYQGYTRSKLGALKLEYPISQRFTLSSNTGAVRSKRDQSTDYDLTERDGGTNYFTGKGDTLSQELRLNVKDWGRATGLLGLYGSRFGNGSKARFENIQVPLSTVVPAPGASNVVARVDGNSLFDDTGKNIALFTEFDFKLGERFTLTTGLRYDRESRDATTLYAITRADGYVGGNETAPPIDLLPALSAAGVLPSSNGVQKASGRYSALLPKLGLRYLLSPAWTLFTTYSEAYRAGGIEVLTGAVGLANTDGSGNSGRINQYKPEYTRNYEVGFRALPFEKVGVNLNVYYVQWRDQQVRVADPNDQFSFSTQNAARSALYGSELETTWKPVRGVNLYLSGGYAHTEFEDYMSSGQNYTGNRFVQAPRFTGSIGGTYKSRRGLFSALSYSTSSSYFSTPDNTKEERGDIRRLLDARLGYQGSAFAIYAYGRNLLDQDYVTSVFRSVTGTGRTEEGRQFSYGDLRRIGAQIEGRF